MWERKSNELSGEEIAEKGTETSTLKSFSVGNQEFLKNYVLCCSTPQIYCNISNVCLKGPADLERGWSRHL